MQALDIVKFEENIKILVAKRKEELEEILKEKQKNRCGFSMWDYYGIIECTKEEFIKDYLDEIDTDNSFIREYLIDKDGNEIENDAITENELDNLRKLYLTPCIEDAIFSINQDSLKHNKRNTEILKSDKFKYICAFVTEDGLMREVKYIYCSKKTFSKIKYFLENESYKENELNCLVYPKAYIDIISEHETLKEAGIKANELLKSDEESDDEFIKFPKEDYLFSGKNYIQKMMDENRLFILRRKLKNAPKNQ